LNVGGYAEIKKITKSMSKQNKDAPIEQSKEGKINENSEEKIERLQKDK
jgi:hypothetical protein